MKTSASVGGVGGGGRRGWKRSREREGGGIHANISFVAPTRLAATIFLVFLHPNLSSIPFFPENSLSTGKKPHYRKVWRPVFPLAVRLPFISRDKMIVMLTQREERGGRKYREQVYIIVNKMILGKEILLRVYHSLFIDIEGRLQYFFLNRLYL